MRKIGTILALAAALLGSEAPFFVGYEHAITSEESTKLFGAQPIEELIGKRKYEERIKFGFTYDAKAKQGGTLYIFGWRAPDANSEVGFGAGVNYFTEFFSSLKAGIGAEIGYGWQSVKGDTVWLSTDATRYGYITGLEVHYGRFAAKMMDDTYLLRVGLNLGLRYDLLPNVAIGVGYRLDYMNYQIEYSYIGWRNYNSITDSHYMHSGTLSLEISF